MRCNIARSIAGGGGSIVIGSYTGNGATTKREITLPGTPTAILLLAGGYNGNSTMLWQGDYVTGSTTADDKTELSGNVLALKEGWYGQNYGYNENNIKYTYIAFF